MITSNQINKLLEEYFKTVSGLMMPTPIFVNPSSTDFKELYQNNKSHEARFILDNKAKKAYIWDANSALHGMVAREVGIYSQFNKNYPEDILSGYGVIRNGKVYMTNSDTLEIIMSGPGPHDKEYLSGLVKINWSWASRYVDSTEFLNKIRSILNK